MAFLTIRQCRERLAESGLHYSRQRILQILHEGRVPYLKGAGLRARILIDFEVLAAIFTFHPAVGDQKKRGGK